jgi:hypothetical protein
MERVAPTPERKAPLGGDPRSAGWLPHLPHLPHEAADDEGVVARPLRPVEGLHPLRATGRGDSATGDIGRTTPCRQRRRRWLGRGGEQQKWSGIASFSTPKSGPASDFSSAQGRDRPCWVLRHVADDRVVHSGFGETPAHWPAARQFPDQASLGYNRGRRLNAGARGAAGSVNSTVSWQCGQVG